MEGKQLDINEDISHFGTGIGKRSECFVLQFEIGHRYGTDKT